MTDTVFNTQDKNAVAIVAKKVMKEAGNADVDVTSPAWSENDELAWYAYCDKHGAKHTAFPDLNDQPEELKHIFAKHMGETESTPVEPTLVAKPNFDHLMVEQEKFEGGKPVPVDESKVRTKNNPDEVNWGVLAGSLAQYGSEGKVSSRKPEEQTSKARVLKRAPDIHVRKEGKVLPADKDLVHRVTDPSFDPSNPERSSMTEALENSAPEHVEPHEPAIVSVPGIDANKTKADVSEAPKDKMLKVR